MVGMIMGAGYASEGVVSRTTVRRGASEAPAPVYPAVYFDLSPFISHLKSFRFVPADGNRRPASWRGAMRRRLGGAVLMTLWHGARLAYRPLAVIFNRLLHYRDYVVLNLPGVRMRWSVGFRFSLPPL
jgi:hypothetical protein